MLHSEHSVFKFRNPSQSSSTTIKAEILRTLIFQVVPTIQQELSWVDIRWVLLVLVHFLFLFLFLFFSPLILSLSFPLLVFLFFFSSFSLLFSSFLFFSFLSELKIFLNLIDCFSGYGNPSALQMGGMGQSMGYGSRWLKPYGHGDGDVCWSLCIYCF